MLGSGYLFCFKASVTLPLNICEKLSKHEETPPALISETTGIHLKSTTLKSSEVAVMTFPSESRQRVPTEKSRPQSSSHFNKFLTFIYSRLGGGGGARGLE